MAAQQGALDLDAARLDPASVFGSPDDVVGRSDLTRDQKIEILRRWEYDAREILVAEEENMAGPDPGEQLDRVLRALHALGSGPDNESTPPTKQGGV
jgi:hypothetical protein